MAAERWLVVLPNWFGETLFATPFLKALRQQRPGAFIATLGWPQCREVLCGSPFVDECLDYDERGRHRTMAGKWRLIRELRRHRFDTAFILRKSLSRTALVWAAGIPRRVGWGVRKSGWLLTHRVLVHPQPRHKALTYLPLLGAVGLQAAAAPYEYTVSPAERQDARAVLAGLGAFEAGRPLVVLHPGANWPHKRWAPERFAAVGDRLAERHRARVLITGGPDDAALAASVRAGMRQPALLLAGQTTLRQLAACLEQAALIIAGDTGVLHIAAALRRPVVALYGPTAPSLTGPLGDPRRLAILHHADSCPHIPCYQPDRPPHPGMQALSVDEVADAASRLLSEAA